MIFSLEAALAGIASVALALVARLAAVAVPVLAPKPFRTFSPGVIPIMTWGGIKDRISIALALPLPDGDWKPFIPTATYVVVIFPIVVQGLTVARLWNRVGHKPDLV